MRKNPGSNNKYRVKGIDQDKLLRRCLGQRKSAQGTGFNMEFANVDINKIRKPKCVKGEFRIWADTFQLAAF